MRYFNAHGYAMAALIVALSVMAVALSVALPVWRTWVQREREAELIFRGEQYMHAIELFQRRTGGFPTSLEALRSGKYIRKLYTDPITNEEFQPVFFGQVAAGAPVPVTPGQRGASPPPRGQGPSAQSPAPTTPGGMAGRGTPAQPPGALQPGVAGAGPIIGVVSKSSAEALRLYNGRGRYNEWLFVATAATQQAGSPTGARAPGMPGARGRDGQRGAPAGRGRGVAPGRPGGLSPGSPGGFPLPTLPGPGRQGPGRAQPPRL